MIAPPWTGLADLDVVAARIWEEVAIVQDFLAGVSAVAHTRALEPWRHHH